MRGTIQRGENSTDQDDWKHKAMSPAHLCLRARNLNNTQRKADIVRKRRTLSVMAMFQQLSSAESLNQERRSHTRSLRVLRQRIERISQLP